MRRIAGARTLHTVSGPFDLIAVVAADGTYPGWEWPGTVVTVAGTRSDVTSTLATDE